MRKRLGLSCNMKKILDNSPSLKKREAISQLGFYTLTENSPLILPPCLSRLGSGGVARGTSQGLCGNLTDIYSSNDD